VSGFTLEYKSDAKDQLYSISYYEKGADAALDTENADVKETEINGNRLIIIEKTERVVLLMFKDSHQYKLGGGFSVGRSLKYYGKYTLKK